MEEIWKEVPGYEGLYEVSSQGRVRSLDREVWNARGCYLRRGRILKQNFDDKMYKTVGLSSHGKTKTCRTHQLVAMAFLGHKPNRYKIVVDHLDNNHLNNNLSNLQLISQRENTSKDKKGYSQYTGVIWNKKTNKWTSRIQIKGKQKYLGYFDSEEEASQYYQDALKSIEEGTEIKVKKPKFSSKYKGVYWDKRCNKWQSSIWINGKQKYLGLFNCETAAFLAYQAELSKISVEN